MQKLQSFGKTKCGLVSISLFSHPVGCSDIQVTHAFFLAFALQPGVTQLGAFHFVSPLLDNTVTLTTTKNAKDESSCNTYTSFATKGKGGIFSFKILNLQMKTSVLQIYNTLDLNSNSQQVPLSHYRKMGIFF